MSRNDSIISQFDNRNKTSLENRYHELANKNGVAEKATPFGCNKDCGLALFTHLGKALAAVNRAVGLGLKGNLRLTATSGAGGGEVLTGTTGGSLASVAAGLAALGLILEAALSVELLLTGGEHELLATLFAY